MPIRSPKWPLSRALIQDAPETPGVYVLWSEDELLYIGSAHGGTATLRTRLTDHLRQAGAGWQPTHFAWEITSRPVRRELELLVEHHESRGAFPRWNRKLRERRVRPRGPARPAASRS